MKHNKNLFLKEPELNGKLKSFIISFLVFVIILAISSVILFMSSLDFNINNLVDKNMTMVEDSTAIINETYSVNKLSGNSDILFILLNSDGNVESVFCTMVDFDNKFFKVKHIDGNSFFMYSEKNSSINDIYEKDSIDGLKKLFLNRWNIEIKKYVVFSKNDLIKFLSSFNGFTVNVAEKVNYKSSEFSLELSKGKQDLSGEKALNYFLICDKNYKEQVLCDIISSVLKPEYVDNADILFKKFVNSSKTDISIIDYSQSVEKLKIYCYAEDKFSATPYNNGESK